jgi:hypothetical protein
MLDWPQNFVGIFFLVAEDDELLFLHEVGWMFMCCGESPQRGATCTPPFQRNYDYATQTSFFSGYCVLRYQNSFQLQCFFLFKKHKLLKRHAFPRTCELLDSLIQ